MFERKGIQTFGSNIFPLPTAIFWRSIFPLAVGAGTGAGHADRSCVDAIFWRAADFAANVVSYQAARILPKTSGGANARCSATPRKLRTISVPDKGRRSGAGKNRNHAETALRNLRGLCAGETVGHARSSQNDGGMPYARSNSTAFSSDGLRVPRAKSLA